MNQTRTRASHHSRSTVFDRRGVRLLIYALVAGIALAYFFEVTSVSGRGYELKKLSDKQVDLATETRRLDLTIAEESSAQNLKKRVEALGMKSATTVEYVHSDKNSVAVR